MASSSRSTSPASSSYSESERPTLPPLRSILIPVLEAPNPVYPIRLRPISPSSSVTSSNPGSRTPSLSPPPSHSADSSFSTACTVRTPSPQSPLPARLRRLSRSPSQDEMRGDSDDEDMDSESNDDRDDSSSRSSSAPQAPTFRLIPTSLPYADAILFVPPPTNSDTNPVMTQLSAVPSISRFARRNPSSSKAATQPTKAQALLLVGPAMRHLNGKDGVRRQIARGARVHPYKIMRNPHNALGLTTPLVPLRMGRPADY